MDYQAVSNWMGFISLTATVVAMIWFFPLNRRKLKAEVRKAETDADKDSYRWLKEQFDALKVQYEELKEEYDILKKRVEGLEDDKKDLEKTNYLYRIAAENLGFWEKIKNEIERIRG